MSNTRTCAPGLSNGLRYVSGFLAMILSIAGSASAATSAFDGYELPANSSGAYISSNGNTNTDSQGRSYTGYGGIGNPGAFGGSARSGNQFLYIESFNGFNASVKQTYSLDPGTYTLSYYEGGRPAPYGAFSYDLVIDGVVKGSYITDQLGGVPSVLRTVPSFTVGVGGTTTVTFQGTAPNNADNMGFFDDLSITAVPEPTSFALLSLGGLVIGRRRRA